ncbi:FkbM family methyltransferase [Streptomyces montanus]|uniref:FkbM family methyltransferase n=1 Tax=Streptomyces montanus TaxID=2580423 RepID=A0A5R9G5J1_9ACTN|nr:FkbM family methyltransferase [Streptomyces montanus]TLS46805.1 FkbM family methyltransferase [Streptomyces montanus]
MQTLYRRLLKLLPKLGMQVLDLGPGDALVSRRGGRTRLPVGQGADLLARRNSGYAVTQVGEDTWVIARDRPAGAKAKAKAKSKPQAKVPAQVQVQAKAAGAWESVRLGDTGAHLLLDPQASAGDERVFQLAAAEYLCAHHVTALLDKYEVNCVFDVGANAGQYGSRLRRLGYTGRIVSFEPTSAAFAKLQKKAANDPDWWVFNFGLGREDATLDIHVDWNSMNSLLPPTDYGRGRYKRFAKSNTEQIEIRRLEAVMEEALDGLADPRPYLKMDTQGYDLEVFGGAGKRIDEFVGMQSEVALLQLYEGSPRMHEAVAVYEDSGFEITGMYPVTREPATGRVVEFDCVMMRATASGG